jgi:RND family efflux transporter MFP subunit
MTWTRFLLVVVLGAGVAGAGLYATGHLQPLVAAMERPSSGAAAVPPPPAEVPAPAVTVARAEMAMLTAHVPVTGSLVAREEILVGPEIEGLRVVEVLADEGDRVAAGQTLARLVSDTLEAQLAQNTAGLARTTAAMAQAQSAIASAEARLEEARNAYDRAGPLAKSGYLSESAMDQREASRRTAEAALASARDGLRVAEAERAQIEAQRREIAWRRARTDINAPAAGLVSRRNAKVGGYASGLADPMFRIVAKGEIELDAEVIETRIGEVREGQKVSIDVAGAGRVEGRVRLVSPEIDRTTRLGRVRIYIGDNPALRVGAFARGEIETAASRGLALPASAVLYSADGPVVQAVIDGRVRTRRVKIGLMESGRIEIREGLADGDIVVARSGTFLRDGDAVRPIGDAERAPGSASVLEDRKRVR